MSHGRFVQVLTGPPHQKVIYSQQRCLQHYKLFRYFRCLGLSHCEILKSSVETFDGFRLFQQVLGALQDLLVCSGEAKT